MMAAASYKQQINKVEASQLRKNVPSFRVGDTIKVHAKIVEGSKERIQVFEGVVIKRHRGNDLRASFTVRKVSYNVGVERTFLLHSPRIDKIQVVSKGKVRRARLFFLRPLRGKASRIKSQMVTEETIIDSEQIADTNGTSTDSKENTAVETAPAVEESSPAA